MFDRLPEYPWQKLIPFRDKAAKHQAGAIDLSVGNPIDPTPEVIQEALRAASNSPGYPTTWGDLETRKAIVNWFANRRRVPGMAPENVTLNIGSKEFISWLPIMLGLSPTDTVVQPRLAYTAYEVGAAFANAKLVATDDPAEWPADTKLVWLNSPGNPNGAVLSKAQLKLAAEKARTIGAVIVNDECYAEFGWEAPWSEHVPCILDPEVTGGDLTGILSIYSLSKQSNLAGYRAAFAAGDSDLIKALVNLRMHSGMMVAMPVQKAMVAALNDHSHVANQKEIYAARRAVLKPALENAGFQIENSEAGLYLWTTRNEGCWETIDWLASLGLVAVPGDFYGKAGERHVRFSITATDTEIAQAAQRLENALG